MSGIQIPGANNYVAPVLANDDDAQANTDGTTGKFLEKYYHDKPTRSMQTRRVQMCLRAPHPQPPTNCKMP